MSVDISNDLQTSFLTLLLILAAWVGHAFGCTVLLNVIYAQHWPRKLLRSIRLLTGLTVFAFPVVAFLLFREVTTWSELNWPPLVFGALCLSISFVVLPVMTLIRQLRPIPRQVVCTSSRVIDIAADLGYRPLGFGKHWRQARVPFNQLFQVEFVDRTYQLPRLPAALDGLTILHLSDLHFHGTPERAFFQRLIERINEQDTPDLVCITGDIVDSVWHQLWIKPLLSQLKWREAGLAILGNHDYWCRPDGVRRQLRRAGFKVLGHETIELTMRGERILAMGHEGPWFPPPLPLPRRKGFGEGFALLLSHTPDNIHWARQNDVDLMLSGHVHGGQVRVPVLGSLFVPSRYSRKYDQGVFFESPTLLSVNRGISGREPLRIHCHPEVTWITLKAG